MTHYRSHMKSEKSSAAEAAFEQEIRIASTQYRKSLPPILEELAQLIENPGRKGARAAARQIAHRLHGTSGSYGLHKVAWLTGEIQDLLDQKVLKKQLLPYATKLRELAGTIVL